MLNVLSKVNERCLPFQGTVGIGKGNTLRAMEVPVMATANDYSRRKRGPILDYLDFMASVI